MDHLARNEIPDPEDCRASVLESSPIAQKRLSFANIRIPWCYCVSSISRIVFRDVVFPPNIPQLAHPEARYHCVFDRRESCTSPTDNCIEEKSESTLHQRT